MKKEWSLANNKVLINFSANYCESAEKVLASEAFKNVIEHFMTSKNIQYSRTGEFLEKHFNFDDSILTVLELKKIFTLLLVMNSADIAKSFPKYAFVYEDRKEFRHFVEEIYSYWRKLERYAIISESKYNEGLLNTSFMRAKRHFDDMMINLYRTITNNISISLPNVFRQLKAGTNAGMVVDRMIWPIPTQYEILKSIPFVKRIVLESPFITYPKRVKRHGFFTEVFSNPLITAKINPEHYFCYPCKIGDLTAYTYVEREFITHGISLCNLFEIPTLEEIAGKKPDLLVVFGASDDRDESTNVFYEDKINGIMMGFIAHNEAFDYFGYMKKILLTIHNLTQMKRGFLPIHGAMVNIVLKNGKSTNIVIMGDSGAGKSESIEAFRSLAEEYISEMTIIFDDMGTFRIGSDGKIRGYGTETGAFVRLDDLDTGYAFKELGRSIFMNPDKINSRVITPVSSYEEIMQGLEVDIFLYANNYEKLEEGEDAITLCENVECAREIFVAGKRMSKGTTTESGITTSYFANPFGPCQKQDDCNKLIDQYFEKLFENDIPVGVIKTQLGIPGMERTGPEIAAVELFKHISDKL